MSPKGFAFASGMLMLSLGILALIPMFNTASTGLPELVLNTSYGLFLGVFPMNILSKLALILLGVAGLGAASAKNSLNASILFSRVVFVSLGLLAILGSFAATNTLYGYWPLYGAEVAFHGVFAVLGAYFGYVYLMTPDRNRRVISGI